jgi:hypothetical protein
MAAKYRRRPGRCDQIVATATKPGAATDQRVGNLGRYVLIYRVIRVWRTGPTWRSRRLAQGGQCW